MPKSTSTWYTPDFLLKAVSDTFNGQAYYDPTPRAPDVVEDGLSTDWSRHKFIYLNPPIPAARWADEALAWFSQPDFKSTIIFAAFSPNVLFQQPGLLRHPMCYIRKRISWIDGRETLLNKEGLEVPNPRFLKGMVGSTQYSAMVLMTKDDIIKTRFKMAFAALGTITPGY
jgi:hypothetical protein